jgi:hypothetical protein
MIDDLEWVNPTDAGHAVACSLPPFPVAIYSMLQASDAIAVATTVIDQSTLSECGQRDCDHA